MHPCTGVLNLARYRWGNCTHMGGPVQTRLAQCQGSSPSWAGVLKVSGRLGQHFWSQSGGKGF